MSVILAHRRTGVQQNCRIVSIVAASARIFHISLHLGLVWSVSLSLISSIICQPKFNDVERK